MRYQCSNCDKSVKALPNGSAPKQCNFCKTWGKIEEVASNFNSNEIKVVRLCDAKIDDPRSRRIQLGFEPINLFFGGMDPLRKGFIIGGTYVFSGDPGVGKSTLLLQIACNCGLDVAYVGCEGEQVQDIRERAERLGYKDCKNVHYIEAENVPSAIPATKGYKVKIYDSLDANVNSGFAMQKALDAVCEDAREQNAVAIVIRQINAGGSAAGPESLRHRVLAAAHLSLEDDETRVLSIEKNRGGKTWAITTLKKRNKKTKEVTQIQVRTKLTLEFEMTETGLVGVKENGT